MTHTDPGDKDTDVATLSARRAPLLWILIPLIAGYILEHQLSCPSPLTLLISALLPASYACTRHGTRSCTFTILAISLTSFLFGWSSLSLRKAQPPDARSTMPPREASIEIKITRNYESRNTTQFESGIAVIINTPSHLSDFIGQKVAYRLKALPSSPIIRSSTWSIKSVLTHNNYKQNLQSKPYIDYLKTNGVFFTLERGKFIKQTKHADFLQQLCNRIKNKLSKSFKGHDYANASINSNLLPALILGNKSLMSDEQKKFFIKSGTMHFFAISGLHIGLLAAIIHIVFRMIKLPSLCTAACGLCLLYIYVELIGRSPSALRAFTMVAFLWGAACLKRRPSPMASICASALLILLIDPTQLWSPGFQLSYTVVFAILTFALPLASQLNERTNFFSLLPHSSPNLIQKSARECHYWLINAACISLAAGISSAALTVDNFSRIAIGGILLNIPLVIAIGLLLTQTLLCAIFLLILPTLGCWLLPGAWLLADSAVALINITMNKLPFLFKEISFSHPHYGECATLIVLASMIIVSERQISRPKSKLLTWALPCILSPLLLLAGSS